MANDSERFDELGDATSRCWQYAKPVVLLALGFWLIWLAVSCF